MSHIASFFHYFVAFLPCIVEAIGKSSEAWDEVYHGWESSVVVSAIEAVTHSFM